MNKDNQLQDVQVKQPINPLIILSVILVLAAAATYLVPAGSFGEHAEGSVVAIDSFKFVDQNPIGPFNFFKSVTLGLQEASYIIFFLLIIGGVFQIVEYTGALHNGLSNLVKSMGKMQLLLIPVCMIVFSIVSSTAACCEEYLAFLPLMYVVCIACGFDSITAVATLFCSAAVGYAGGMLQPFSVGVAQGIAGLEPFSGIGMRLAVFCVLLVITIIYVMRHAWKVKNHPEKNYMAEIDKQYADKLDLEEVNKITGRQKAILVVFGLGFVAVAVSVMKFGFFIDEMSAIFIIVGILVAIIGGLKLNEVAEQFIEGCRNLLWAGMIIGLCTAVTLIMKEANVMDTLVYGMGSVVKDLPPAVSACGMFVMQDMLNFLIPSGSGQAAITMPFMAPLSDLIGLTRQTAVLAFQMGDAFTNVVAPTSGELMAALAICHVPYRRWLRFLAPLWGMWAIVACVFLVIAVMTGYK